MSDELPSTWVTAPLDKLSVRIRGVSYARDEASGEPRKGSLPILRANNIENDRLVFDDLVYVPTSRVSEVQRIKKGDVVIAMSSGSKNVVGKTAQATADWEGAFGAFCGVLRASPELNWRYLGLFLHTRDYRHRISELAAGTNINNLKAEHFSEIEVPVAPLGEQRRIVAKLEELLGKVDACQQRLAKIPVLLKRFRQGVLAAACSGRLTADWREDNNLEESGEELLAHVIEDRRQWWETTQLEAFERAGRIPKNSEWKRKYVEPFGPDVEGLESLPTGWAWGTWNQVSNWVTYGFTRPMPHVEQGIPIVTAKHVLPRTIKLSETDRTTKEAFNELSEKDRPTVGDILITKDGSIGRAAIVETSEPFCINQSVAVVWLRSRTLNRTFLLAAIQWPVTQNRIAEKARGAAIQHLSITDFARMPVPIPPLAEQEEIVRRVNGLFALADQIEARYAKAKVHIEKLTPSLLARAFRGELVPQDPNDEPASVLLERIRSGRQRDNGGNRKRKRAALAAI